MGRVFAIVAGAAAGVAMVSAILAAIFSSRERY